MSQTASAVWSVQPPAKTDNLARVSSLVGVEEVEAPFERCPERSLAGRKVARPADEQRQARVESAEELRRGEHPDAACGELDRERQAVEPLADAADRGLVGRLGPEARVRLLRALDEELDRGIRREGRHRVDVLPGEVQDDSAGDEDRHAW